MKRMMTVRISLGVGQHRNKNLSNDLQTHQQRNRICTIRM